MFIARQLEIALNLLPKLALIAAALCLISACQKAVKAPSESIYRIEGSKQSTLYPLEVKQNGEDVFIQLKPGAPLPEIISLDLVGNKMAFNYHFVNDTIVIPGKFEHIRLLHNGDDTIDIFSSTK